MNLGSDEEDSGAVIGIDSDDPDFDPLEEPSHYRRKRTKL
jgi:hypothetical protein